jgi:broad specificity phosphatase PhoE
MTIEVTQRKSGGRTIILVRHGESDYNKKNIIQGQSDYSKLTALGKEQSNAAGEFLNGININKVFSSPLSRAFETASLISNQNAICSSNIIKDDNLLEIDFDHWIGQDRKSVMEKHPTSYKIWRQRPFDLVINDKYPVRELYRRVGHFLKMLHITNHTNVVVVGHKGTISCILNLLLGLPKSHHHCFQIDRGSVSVLRQRDGVAKDSYELLCSNTRPLNNQTDLVDFKTEERTKSFGEVYLIRHGQTDSNLSGIYQGGKDKSLSHLGKENVKQLSKSFFPLPPARIVCSDLNRAKESALILAKSFGLETIAITNKLHEFLYGSWEGMTEKDVKKYRKNEYEQWIRDPENSDIPNAELINDAYNRCGDIWNEYNRDINSWSGSIISVAHDIVNRLMICKALDLPIDYIWCFNQMNASVSVLGVKNSLDGKLRMLNHCPYPLTRRLNNEWL